MSSKQNFLMCTREDRWSQVITIAVVPLQAVVCMQ
jgi:hypothetical protein